jgi:glycine/D-amino acid oxidase-like deaminating enzyme
MPFQVTKQSAGIRPNIHGFTPVIGSHSTVDGLAFFNGLGSKGSLLAPMMSDQLARHLVLGEPVSRDVDVRFRMRGERS